ncbi:chloride channel protein [Ligilactobacillus sp. WILCCON 0076]|uniref:Chloride channel protein n=1 Tax=Ligilactobacillus ubinensis TaxID=2876789 RepID=A0A9X2JLP9_9LACO|nr:chloride channel protein [Ligilactobacillus ubinensis]MCP0887129.1 chloride channel protein [Ligilactobacillus ubinensis]
MKKVLEKENLVLLFSTLVLGIIVGISSLLLSLLLDVVERVFLSFQESASYPASLAVSPIHRVISVFIGGIIAAVIWWKIRPAKRSTTTIAQALDGQKMAPFQTIIHVMNQIFYVGTGGSVGRELAPREAGSMFAQGWTGFLKKWHLELTAENKKLLIAAAAGAGFAGVYSAPLTGMLFCVEILLKKVTKKTVIVSLTMSSIAMVIGTIVKGIGPYYIVGKQRFSFMILFAVIVVAPICGFIGAIFRKSFKWAEKNQTRDKKILWQLPIAGLLTGVIAAFFPQIMGNGRALAQLSIDTISYKILGVILLGAFLKAIITVITIKNGAAGGTLTPSISIGAVIGTIIGVIFHSFFISIPIWQFSLLGACSLLAASQQAPLMALMMIIEICHLNYSAILPLGVGVSLAIIVSKLALKDK